MQYMLPLDAVDDEFATFRIPVPMIDDHSIADPPPRLIIEVKLDKQEWWAQYKRAGDVTVEVWPVDVRPPAEIMDEMLNKVGQIVDRMKRGEENEEYEAAVGIFADQLTEAITWPTDVTRQDWI